jgi:hypothetical protein
MKIPDHLHRGRFDRSPSTFPERRSRELGVRPFTIITSLPGVLRLTLHSVERHRFRDSFSG